MKSPYKSHIDDGTSGGRDVSSTHPKSQKTEHVHTPSPYKSVELQLFMRSLEFSTAYMKAVRLNQYKKARTIEKEWSEWLNSLKEDTQDDRTRG